MYQKIIEGYVHKNRIKDIRVDCEIYSKEYVEASKIPFNEFARVYITVEIESLKKFLPKRITKQVKK